MVVPEIASGGALRFAPDAFCALYVSYVICRVSVWIGWIEVDQHPAGLWLAEVSVAWPGRRGGSAASFGSTNSARRRIVGLSTIWLLH